MKIEIKNCTTEYFKIPFIAPIQVGSKKLLFREGYILRIECVDGRVGFGELAPLAGLDIEELDQVIKELNTVIKSLKNIALDSDSIHADEDFLMPLTDKMKLSKCVKFCLEGAWLDLLGKLTSQEPIDYCKLTIPGTGDDLKSSKTVKIKIGRQSPQKDIELINQISRNCPNTRLRLDGNRQLTPEQFIQIISNIDSNLIEYVEEPFECLQTWEEVYSKLPQSIALAIDESLALVLSGDVKLPVATSVFVIKPTLYGGISDTIRIIKNAKTFDPGISSVISSSFNTSVGIAALVYLSNFQNRLKNVAAGIDTYRFFNRPDSYFELAYSDGVVKVGSHT